MEWIMECLMVDLEKIEASQHKMRAGIRGDLKEIKGMIHSAGSKFEDTINKRLDGILVSSNQQA
jgi:hypothetical protein